MYKVVKVSYIDIRKSSIASSYPSPVIKIIDRASFFLGVSCSRRTPEIGSTKMNTSDTSAHAANGMESFLPILFRGVKELSSQV